MVYNVYIPIVIATDELDDAAVRTVEQEHVRYIHVRVSGDTLEDAAKQAGEKLQRWLL